jgi:1,2-dihydroxy-3-keto-5-methylthiopentene dioxygenase
MATVYVPNEKRMLTEKEEICQYLNAIGITYERWQPAHELAESASGAEVLAAYASEIERLKTEGGYVTADVIDVLPTTPGLDAMLNRFNSGTGTMKTKCVSSSQGAGCFIFVHGKGM